MAKAKKKVEVEEGLAAEIAAVEGTAPEVAADAPALDAETLNVPPDTLIEVWERRFTNPGARPSTPIPLKVEGMTVRWINTAVEGRHHRAVYEQGWQPVPIKLLKDAASIPDLYKHPHGIVARGERGKEVLMMMPMHVFEKIQKRKAELTLKSLRNIREEVAGAAASRFGPEAGDFMSGGQTADGNIKAVGTIKFGVERVGADE